MPQAIYFNVDRIQYVIDQPFSLGESGIVGELSEVIAYVKIDENRYFEVVNPFIEYYLGVYRLTFPGLCMTQEVTVLKVSFTNAAREIIAEDLNTYVIRQGITFLPVVRFAF